MALKIVSILDSYGRDILRSSEIGTGYITIMVNLCEANLLIAQSFKN